MPVTVHVEPAQRLARAAGEDPRGRQSRGPAGQVLGEGGDGGRRQVHGADAADLRCAHERLPVHVLLLPLHAQAAPVARRVEVEVPHLQGQQLAES